MNHANAFHHLILDPIEKRSPALASLRLSQLLHERAGGRFDEPMRQLGAWLNPKVRLPAPAAMSKDTIALSVSALKRRGWDLLPWRLGPDEIASIRAFAFSTPAYAVKPT